MSERSKEFYARQNRIMEKLAGIKLTESQHKYCWVEFRKTFGWGKYEDIISRDQFAKLTGMLETNVSHTRTELKDRNIIYMHKKKEGFNLNTDQWDKVSPHTLFETVSPHTPNSVSQADNNSVPTHTYKETTKKLSPKKDSFYKEMLGKKINDLEGDPWYKAIMWNEAKFSIDYIEETIRKYSFNTRMNCWYLYANASKVIDKEAYFTKLLRDYSEK